MMTVEREKGHVEIAREFHCNQGGPCSNNTIRLDHLFAKRSKFQIYSIHRG